MACLEERIRRRRCAKGRAAASATPERDMSGRATRAFAQQLEEQREARCSRASNGASRSAIRASRARYAERQTELRGALAAAMEQSERATSEPRTHDVAEDVASIVMSVIGAAAVDELIEPGSVRPAAHRRGPRRSVYAGLVARAQGTQTLRFLEQPPKWSRRPTTAGSQVSVRLDPDAQSLGRAELGVDPFEPVKGSRYRVPV